MNRNRKIWVRSGLSSMRVLSNGFGADTDIEIRILNRFVYYIYKRVRIPSNSRVPYPFISLAAFVSPLHKSSLAGLCHFLLICSWYLKRASVDFVLLRVWVYVVLRFELLLLQVYFFFFAFFFWSISFMCLYEHLFQFLRRISCHCEQFLLLSKIFPSFPPPQPYLSHHPI